MSEAQRGFTLIELLVVISIIGLLSTIAIVSLNGARAKARDVKRKADLQQILLALEDYHTDTGSYAFAGGGWSGVGYGWFNYQDTVNYTKSIANAMKEAGYFTDPPYDPLIRGQSQQQNGEARQYMVYNCYGRGIFIYAHLEKPSAEDLATYDRTKANGCYNLDAYHMNYAFGHMD